MGPAPRISIALAAALALCASGCGRPIAKSDACDVALYAFQALAVEKQRSARWILTPPTELPRFAPLSKVDPDQPPTEVMPFPETLAAIPGPGEIHPQASTLQALARERPAGVETCPAVRNAARALHVLPATPPPARPLGPDGLYAVEYVTMSRPALSADGAEALVYVAYSSGPLAASGHLFLLRRDTHGAWSVAGASGLWIS